jgi:hypothetical protein
MPSYMWNREANSRSLNAHERHWVPYLVLSVILCEYQCLLMASLWIADRREAKGFLGFCGGAIERDTEVPGIPIHITSDRPYIPMSTSLSFL